MKRMTVRWSPGPLLTLCAVLARGRDAQSQSTSTSESTRADSPLIRPHQSHQ
jgi:hypothetical protein